ncbi:hypothetical protein KCV03_g64, partial [Aureobasidium melanogenum]
MGHLPVSSANADGRDAKLFCDQSCNLGWYGFNDHCKSTRLLYCQCVLVLSLGSKANVSEDRDAGGCDLLDGRSHLSAAFELDTVDAASLDHGDCGLKGLVG